MPIPRIYNNLQERGLEPGDYTTLNLTDADAATWIFLFEEYPSAYRLRPRTIGASLRYSFGGL